VSNFVVLIIGEWATAAGVIGFFALKESGKLLQISKRIGLWVDAPTARLSITERSSPTEDEEAARNASRGSGVHLRIAQRQFTFIQLQFVPRILSTRMI
jgi:hypothetical protein